MEEALRSRCILERSIKCSESGAKKQSLDLDKCGASLSVKEEQQSHFKDACKQPEVLRFPQIISLLYYICVYRGFSLLPDLSVDLQFATLS